MASPFNASLKYKNISESRGFQKRDTTFEANRPVDLKEVVTHELLVTIAIFEISGKFPSDVKSTKVLPLMGEQQHRPLLPQPPEQSTQDH